ncbi:MAG: septal ring lytic transglycosylase RlpA family protein [Deltaproteobacteria bacterium]|nr:septal ring lytic transglycosylase RlpA family protein [Deltaproteobacteria bacterium]MBW1921391.1 septal ring lytic transglycosylase RlpA family protein [Deltaproteobacteria bacterium]MBW1935811.1 septal ring lytic transglycosylase RlpA family protein [Deltaproteobacteria bacterium]MBW1977476.1 septal ring lytic transglycosylase RlpA family protein [Deltaproteobacteria bacterium]MBW2299687.1 septal ring lytic transglycosylase RlpA family protein [Deltaproteobacteria bacterium]
MQPGRYTTHDCFVNSSKQMSRILLGCFVTFLCLSSCVHENYYPTTPLPQKVIPVLETRNGEAVGAFTFGGSKYYPLPDPYSFVQYGRASWYGRKFHGRLTASGEVYNMHALTAAHKTLPLGTVVRVVNLTNGKSAVVRVNDRGPFVKNRIIDLSYAAAKKIGLVGPGVAEVKITGLGKQVGLTRSGGTLTPLVAVPNFTQGVFAIQVGAFLEKGNALHLAERLRAIYDYVDVSIYIDESRTKLYRVRVSRAKSLTSAAQIEQKLEDMGFEDAFIVRI